MQYEVEGCENKPSQEEGKGICERLLLLGGRASSAESIPYRGTEAKCGEVQLRPVYGTVTSKAGLRRACHQRERAHQDVRGSQA